MNNKRQPADAPDNSNKKLRQTTLSWASKSRAPPRPPGNSEAATSPYFKPRRPRTAAESEATLSPPPPTQNHKAKGRGRERREDTAEDTSSIPRQYFFTVPSWCRPIRRINMASATVKHDKSLQEIACLQLFSNPGMIENTTASAESALYVDQRDAKVSPYKLNPSDCPKLPKTGIRIVKMDTLDTAIRLIKDNRNSSVGVLNLANAVVQGGGWLEGTTAQEEQLCYRTTLAETLRIEYYPLPDVCPMPGDKEAIAYVGKQKKRIETNTSNDVSLIYSPSVAIYRTGPPGYEVYDLTEKEPEIISVFSVAALDLRSQMRFGSERSTIYPHPEQREIMKDKIRLLLRIAARKGVRRLVLGALGCGVFSNPPEEVARIFAEVFKELEFDQGWWEDIAFAILPDRKGALNFDVFDKVLGGMSINNQ